MNPLEDSSSLRSKRSNRDSRISTSCMNVGWARMDMVAWGYRILNIRASMIGVVDVGLFSGIDEEGCSSSVLEF